MFPSKVAPGIVKSVKLTWFVYEESVVRRAKVASGSGVDGLKGNSSAQETDRL